MERVLVTGANGHLGRRLVAFLAGRPAPPAVRAVVRSRKAAATLEALPGGVRPEVQVVDYLDPSAMGKVASGCDRIVHLVGILKEGASSRYEVAHEGTSRILARAASDAGARRLVYLSILGASADSSNACLASKARAEAILRDGATPVTVLRVPMVLGPGELAALALRARARARFALLPRGGASREQPIDAEDVVRAIGAALEDAGRDDHVYELAGPESLPARALLERAAAVLGTSPRVVPVPLSLLRAIAALLERVASDPPLTRAMLGVLDHDDDVDPTPACRALGLTLTPLDRTLRRALEADA